MRGEEGVTLCTRCFGTGTEPDQSQVGAEMKAKRKAAGISLKEMAKRTVLSEGFLCDLEHGNRTWKTAHRRAYLEGLRR